jgi:hypothetical protein
MNNKGQGVKLTKAEARGREEGKLALYFGCWDRPGHYLHRPGGATVWATRDVPGLSWSETLMDGGLLKNGQRPDICDGKVFSTCGGLAFWWAFFWWDRSGDRRQASNSGFYVRGFGHDERAEAFAYACEQFPHVVSRQQHPLTLQASPAALEQPQ